MFSFRWPRTHLQALKLDPLTGCDPCRVQGLLLQWINLPLTCLHINCFAAWNGNCGLFLNEAGFTIDKENRKVRLPVSI